MVSSNIGCKIGDLSQIGESVRSNRAAAVQISRISRTVRINQANVKQAALRSAGPISRTRLPNGSASAREWRVEAGGQERARQSFPSQSHAGVSVAVTSGRDLG